MEAVNEMKTFPYRMRSDYGGENVKVADCVIQHRGPGSHLCISSRYNTRIELLWREVRRMVTQFYW